jgi:TPP-dependent pyruvate/acetoin dehydrogenase alpha subunit
LTICHAILDLAIEVQRATRQLYVDMLRIRLIEEEIAARYKDGKMRCPIHLSIGQEAVAVGVSAALRRTDQVVSTHRCHAHYLAKGGDLKAMLCEIMGREPGCCAGRGGSMHLFDDAAGVLLSVPIVGAAIPIGVGAALAMKHKKKGDVAVTYFGDAAVEEGVFHESANFAAVHHLPAILVCENNLYSGYSPLSERQPDRPLTELARGHGLDIQHIDGNDVFAVRDAATKAVARGRAGEGPSFILADTYRLREHCGPDYDHMLGYRTPQEFESWEKRDPLLKLHPALGDAYIETAQRIIAAEIAEAFAFAEDAPFPDPETVGEHVYAE